MARLIPRDPHPDATLALLRDPYRYISRQCRARGSDVFETRLLLERTLCMTGSEAARVFYSDRFVRSGAMPTRIQKTLLGTAGVQSLDGAAHRQRKRMFVLLTEGEHAMDLASRFAAQLRDSIPQWERRERIALHDEMVVVLTRCALSWLGIPIAEPQVGPLARDLAALFLYAGSVGPRHWQARLARGRCERWAAAEIEQARARPPSRDDISGIARVAWHRQVDGTLLDPHEAAVELLNLIRPTVAVSVFIVFVAHALHVHPECGRNLEEGSVRHEDAFLQEVRRSYPFFPAVAARVREAFEWQGFAFPAGRRVLLDLYGTDHDPRVWEAPEEFRPERFLDREPGRFELVPQGGGDPATGHRCPGEHVALELMRAALDALLRGMRYEVPPQDLALDWSALPALPRSGFEIARVRAVVRPQRAAGRLAAPAG
jgi:fatty-acid peroxygenase